MSHYDIAWTLSRSSSERFVLGTWVPLGLELVRPERLPQLFPSRPDELRAPDDLYLRSGAVAAHVFFLEYILQRHALVCAPDDVLEDLLLALRERNLLRGQRTAAKKIAARSYRSSLLLVLFDQGLILPGELGVLPESSFTEASGRCVLGSGPSRKARSDFLKINNISRRVKCV